MSPQAGIVLMQEIAPRLKNVVPHIKPVGCEDGEELYQDGLAMAAKMLHELEVRGKVVTPGNVCYYVTLHLKSGRRSHSSGRTDVMGSGTQLDHSSAVLSFEDEVGYDPELAEPITLGEMLTCSQDDPSMTAGRNLDWESFLDSHDYRYGVIVRDIAEGTTALAASRERRESYHYVRQLRERLVEELREFMGLEAIADSAKIPSWRGNLLVDREKAACRADRRRY